MASIRELPAIKERVFTSKKGNLIEIIGITTLGKCQHPAHVNYWEPGVCPHCFVNCKYQIKVNGVHHMEDVTHMELFKLQPEG